MRNFLNKIFGIKKKQPPEVKPVEIKPKKTRKKPGQTKKDNEKHSGI